MCSFHFQRTDGFQLDSIHASLSCLDNFEKIVMKDNDEKCELDKPVSCSLLGQIM